MKYTYTLFLSLLSLCLWGQTKSHQAPLNPAFVNQLSKEGYIHPPHLINHQASTTKSSSVLPASFDLRNVDNASYIPNIRNQNPYGTCWAFGAYASLESHWKVSGDNSFTDLSEGNMAKCHGYDFGINEGGNEYMSTAYLTRLAGPVYESSDPYEDVDSSIVIIDKTVDIPAYIDNVLWLGDDINNVKQTIMDYGAVATSMKSDFTSDYYNDVDYTFFYNGSEVINHGVSIVGWDDDKIVTGGRKGTPTSTGAWIVRNSWGSSSNDNGYFYASYEDTYIGKSCELYYGKTSIYDIDTLFDYAKLGAITAYNGGESSNDYAYAAVKYHANTDYFITHIGAAILSEGTTLEITLCSDFDGTTFSDTIAHTTDVFCTYPGYQKIEFPAVVLEGDFYLIMKYHTPNVTFPLPAETEIDNYCYPEIEEGKMWISANALEWAAAGLNTSYDFDLAVKVIAKHIGETQAYFSTDKTQACFNQELVFENKTVGEADSFLWYFPEDTFVTYSTEESITISFATVGEKRVSLIALRDGISYTFDREKAVEVINQIYPTITIISSEEYFSKGNPVTMIASGGDSYQWYADGYLTGESGRVISFSPDVDSIWVKLEASMGNCFEVDSVLIKMVEVPYDNIEDALLLTVNKAVSGISNQYASVQEQEPAPELGSCDSQNTWCEEGGLQNSLWFEFIAPESGKVSIYTSGFDNQIALYDAVATGECEDILSGTASNYSIIAANDDYHSIDYSAEIEQVDNLTPNKTYWIQVDGSAGGQSGVMSITVKSQTSLLQNELDMTGLNYINTKDKFQISSEILKGATISMINSLGQVILKEKLGSAEFTANGQEFSEGFYLIDIQSEGYKQVFKVVISDNWELSIDAQ